MKEKPFKATNQNKQIRYNTDALRPANSSLKSGESCQKVLMETEKL
jgi:hypothetical protein